MKLLLIVAVATIFAISSADIISDSLEAHNKYRNALGIQSLTWSSSLAKNAQAWADYLARTRRTSHSKNRNNVGENLAYGSSRNSNAAKFVDMWAEESEDFVPGKNYPKCSRTGDESDVWHYTQMIWEKTTQVGCGMGSRSGRNYYVCQYYPAGNRRNQPVYTVREVPAEEDPVVEEPVEEEEPSTEQPSTEEPAEPVEEEPPVPVSEDPLIAESLDAHNKYRSALGIPSLAWSSTLAQSAQAWADHLAKNKQFSHSKNRDNIGENIAYGTANTNNAAKFVDLWAEEREYFVAGKNYPECSSTGDQSDVWHYTQMIWKKTTQVGCGMGTNSGRLYYVCQYSPAGNFRGQPVY